MCWPTSRGVTRRPSGPAWRSPPTGRTGLCEPSPRSADGRSASADFGSSGSRADPRNPWRECSLIPRPLALRWAAGARLASPYERRPSPRRTPVAFLIAGGGGRPQDLHPLSAPSYHLAATTISGSHSTGKFTELAMKHFSCAGWWRVRARSISLPGATTHKYPAIAAAVASFSGTTGVSRRRTVRHSPRRHDIVQPDPERIGYPQR